MHPAEDAHERALAGAVLPHQRMHLARRQGQVDPSQRVHAAERLLHAAQFGYRGGRKRHRISSVSTPELAINRTWAGVASVTSTLPMAWISVIALSPARSNFEPSSIKMA